MSSLLTPVSPLRFHLYAVKICCLTLALCAATSLFMPRAANAQGYWQTGWGVTDQNGTVISPNGNDGSYTLRTLPDGAASNTFPSLLTQQAMASPYTASNGSSRPSR